MGSCFRPFAKGCHACLGEIIGEEGADPHPRQTPRPADYPPPGYPQPQGYQYPLPGYPPVVPPPSGSPAGYWQQPVVGPAAQPPPPGKRQPPVQLPPSPFWGEARPGGGSSPNLDSGRSGNSEGGSILSGPSLSVGGPGSAASEPMEPFNVDEDPLLSKIKVHPNMFRPVPSAPPLPMSPSASGAPSSSSGHVRRPSGGGGGVDRAAEVDYRHLTMQKLLGEGSYGRVYCAKYREGRLAVKVLASIEDLDFVLGDNCPLLARLREEAQKMAVLRHDHVIRLKAICIRPPCLLTEYCSNRSLADVLEAAAHKDPAKAQLLTWRRRVRMALDAARGMAFLHCRTPAIIHANLKSCNLLVTRENRVKVSDVNVRQLVDVDVNNQMSTLSAMSPHHMAPEVLLAGHAELTPACDVYSYGVCLWELLTWQKPWDNKSPWAIVQLVTGGGVLAVPPDDQLPGPDRLGPKELKAYKALMESCLVKNYHDRPSFAEIIPKLE